MEGWRDDIPIHRSCVCRGSKTRLSARMTLVIPYPHIDPVFLRIGPVQLRWYGLMYMLSFIIGYFLLKRNARRRKLNLSNDDIYDLLFYLILGRSEEHTSELQSR